MLQVVPPIIWNGMCAAIYSGNFVPMMNKQMLISNPEYEPNTKLGYSLFAMIPLGLGEVIGGFMVGFVIDKWRQKAGVIFCMFTTAIAYALTFGWIA